MEFNSGFKGLKRKSGDGGVHINYNNTSYGVMPIL